MKQLHRRIERIWWRRASPPLLLRCIEPLYAILSRLHQQHRAAHPAEPPLPLISVGNITAGGSGKTPFVLWLAKALQSDGRSPVILCRGDGGSRHAARLVRAEDSAAAVGDEAKMMAAQAVCPVIAAADRIAGSRLAATHGDLIILDDGFQYRHLARCCDIVLVPAEGVGNGHLIPAGPLREPLSALDRADIIVRTGSDTELAECSPLGARAEWRWQRNAGALIDANGVRESAPDCVHAVTAIGRPERFFNDLQAVGLTLAGATSFPDHHRFSDSDLHGILQLHEHIAVTAKDAVKLLPRWPADRPLWLLPVGGQADPGLITAIRAHIPAT